MGIKGSLIIVPSTLHFFRDNVLQSPELSKLAHLHPFAWVLLYSSIPDLFISPSVLFFSSSLANQASFPGGASGKESVCQSRRQEMQVRSLGQEEPLEEGRATDPRILDWRIPRTEKPSRLQSMGSQRVGRD